MSLLLSFLAVTFIKNSGVRSDTFEAISIGDVEQRIDNFRLIQFDGPDIQWEISAERVDKWTNEEDAVVREIDIRYQQSKNEVIRFNAEKGKFNINKNIFVVREEDGGVAVEIGDEIMMRLSQLTWYGNEKEIKSQGRIQISGDKFELQGDELIAKLDKGVYEIRKNIRATLW